MAILLSHSLFAQGSMSTRDYAYSFSDPTYTALSSGTAVPGLSLGATTAAVKLKLPFSFPFQGRRYDSLWVTNRGYITLGTVNGAPNLTTSPISGTSVTTRDRSVGYPEGIISVFGATMYASTASGASGAILTDGNSSQYTIEWRDVTNVSADALRRYNFQIVLSSNGNIRLHYGPATSTTTTASTGQAGIRTLYNFDYLNFTVSSGTTSWANLNRASLASSTASVSIATGNAATVGNRAITLTPPSLPAETYATLPFSFGFDNTWTTSSTASNVKFDDPGTSVTNWPRSGFSSARRANTAGHINAGTGTATTDTAGSGWTNISGNNGPTSRVYAGTGAARVHFWNQATGTVNDMDFYLNLSPAGDKIVTFYTASAQNSTSLGISCFLSTDGGATFNRVIPVGSSTPYISNSTAWGTTAYFAHNINLGNVTASQAVFRIRTWSEAASGGSNDFFLDEFSVKASNCPQASVNAPVVNSPTSATLSWSAASGATAYVLRYRAGTTGPWTSVNVTGTSHTINTLTGNTTYNWSLRTTCGADTSVLITSGTSFSTPCAPLTYNDLPITQDFNTAPTAPATIANCWSAVVVSPSTRNWGRTTTTARSGSAAFLQWEISTNAPNGNNAYLFAQGITLAKDQSIDISFWRRHYSTGSAVEKMQVRVGTDATVAAAQAGTLLKEYVETALTTYTSDKLTFSAPAAGTYYVTWYGFSDNDKYGWMIDDVTFSKTPACRLLSNITATPLNGTTIQINANTITAASSYRVRYRLAGASTWTDSATNVTLPITLSGLAGSSGYQYQIRALCAGEPAGQQIGEYSNTLAFSTPCPSFSFAALPYTEGFETIATGQNLPSCWTRRAQLPAGGLWTTATTNPRTGTKAATFGSEAFQQANAFLSTPGITMTAGQSIDISFWRRNASTTAVTMELRVGTDSTPTAAMAGTLVASYSEGSTSYVQDVQTFVAPASGTYYIFWRATNIANTTGWFLDDITISRTPLCKVATELTATNATTNSVLISGTGPGVASGYRIRYRPAGTTAYDSVTVASLPATINGLLHSTTYEFNVRTLCSGQDADNQVGPYSIAGTFTTLCNTFTLATLPINQSFEGLAVGALPNCWTNMTVAPFDKTWGASTTAARTGSNSVYLNYNSSVTSNASLISPAISLTSGQSIDVSWWYRTSCTSFTENMEVRVVTDTTATGLTEGTLLRSFTSYANNTYANALESFVAPAAGTYFVIWRSTSTPNQCGWYMDDISITKSPVCKAPTGLSVSNITTSAARISVTTFAAATSFRVRYRLAGASTWTDSLSGSLPLNLSGLTAASGYEYQVRALCANEPAADQMSAYSQTATFNTACAVLSAASLPISQGFEGLTAGNLPNCWNNKTVAPFDKRWGASTSSVRTGSNSVFLGYNTSINSNASLISPAIALTAGQGLEINWWYRTSCSSFTENMEVRVVTDTTAAGLTGGTLLRSFTNYASTTYANEISGFEAPTAGTYFVVWRSNSTPDQCGWYMDDITISKAPVCGRITNIVGTGTLVGITPAGNISATGVSAGTGYTVRYRVSSSSVWTDSVTATSFPITLPNLAATTTYQFQVRALCTSQANPADRNGVYSATNTFTTPCAPTTYASLPIVETFDNTPASGFSLATCWGAQVVSPAARNWVRSTTNARSGNAAYLQYEATNSTTGNPEMNAFLFSRGIALSAGQSIDISFWRRTNSTATEQLQVLVGTDATPAAALSGTTLEEYSEINQTYTNDVLTFTAPSAGTYYVAFRGRSANNTWGWHIDDVTISATPACRGLANIAATALTSSSVSVNASTLAAASQYRVRYRLTGASTWTDSITQASLPITISGLAGETSYQYQVRALCAAETPNTGRYSNVLSFSTPCAAATFASLPLIEGFEANPANSNLPTCWGRRTGGTAGQKWTTVSDGATARTGSNAVFMGSESFQPANSYLFSRGIALTAGQSIDISFWRRTNSTSVVSMELRVANDSTVNAALANAALATYSEGNTTYRYDIQTYTAPATGVYYVVWRATNPSSTSGWYLDDITISRTPNCRAIANGTVSNILLSTATITPSSAAAATTSLRVRYRVAGNANWTDSTTGTGTGSVNLSGLASGTNYEFQIRSLCAGEPAGQQLGAYSNTGTFATRCPARTWASLSTPLVEDFEGTPAVNGLPLCWNEKAIAPFNQRWVRSTSGTRNSSAGSVFLNYNSSVASNSYLISPGITMATGQSIDISYWRRVGSSTWSESMDVEVVTDTTAAGLAAGTVLASYTSETSTTYRSDSKTFIAPAAGTYYVVWQGKSTSNQFGWYMDDITISQGPSCNTPATPTSSNVRADRATVTFNANSFNDAGTTTYQYRVRAGSAAYGAPVTATPGANVITGLTPSTTHRVQVRAVCNGTDFGRWTDSVQFTTPAAQSVSSVTVVQTTTANIARADNQEVLRLTVSTSGNGGGYRIGSLTVNSLNTSDAGVQATLWKGAASDGSNAWQIAGPVSFTSGVATLSPAADTTLFTTGTTYLFVRYNIAANTPLGRVFDASIPSGGLVLTNIAPSSAASTLPSSLQSPTGSRSLNFCLPTANCATASITNVTLSNTALNNSSTCGTGYAKFAAAGSTTGTVNRGLVYTLSVTTGGSASQNVAVWADLDNSGSFETTEYLSLGTGVAAGATVSGSISVPLETPMDTVRIRVRTSTTALTSASACSNVTAGETEDYVVAVAAAPTCIAPQNFVVTNITPFTADVQWSSLLGAQSYTLQTRVAGSSTWGTTWQASGTGRQLYDLQPGITYEVQIRSNCGATFGNSAYSLPVTFTTACRPVESLTQNFDGTVACWSAGMGTGRTQNWAASTTYRKGTTGSGRAVAAEPSSNGLTNDAYLYTPAMALKAGRTYDIRFSYRQATGTAGRTDALALRVGSTMSPAGVSTVVWSRANITSQLTFTDTLVRFTPTVGGNYFFAFHAYSNNNQGGLAVDDISILPAQGNCAAPGAVSATVLSATSVSANALNVPGDVTMVRFIVRNRVSNILTTHDAAVSALPFTITGLASGTQHEISVASICGAQVSANTALTVFTTQPSADDPCNALVAEQSLTPKFFTVNTMNATTTSSALAPVSSCGTIANDVWYRFVANATHAVIATRAATGVSPLVTNSRLAVYGGTCNSLVAVSCDDDNGPASHANLQLNNLVAGNTYYVRVGASTATSGYFDLSISQYDQWLGTTNNTATVSNYASQPDALSDSATLYIGANTPNAFTLNANRGVNHLFIERGARLVLNAQLNVFGNVNGTPRVGNEFQYVEGQGTLNFAGGRNQNVNVALSLFRVALNKSTTAASVLLNQPVMIEGRLNLTQGRLEAGANNLILASDADNTAQVEAVTVPGNLAVNGTVEVRQYMPRSIMMNTSGGYAFVGANVTGATLSSFTWNNAITGVPGLAPGATSVWFYNPAIGTWQAPKQDTAMTPGRGANMFIRQSVFNGAGYLRLRGGMVIGDVTQPLSTANNGFNLVANPYAATLNWDTTNTAWPRTGLDNTYYVFSAKDSVWKYYQRGTGNIDPVGGLSKYIASGQGFMVRSTGASSITFVETAKSWRRGSVSRVREAAIANLHVGLTGRGINDNFDVVVREGASASFEDNSDAMKLGRGISTLTADGKQVSINAIPAVTGKERIALSFNEVGQGSYSLNFDNLATLTNMQVSLEDKFTKTVTPLLEGSRYDFVINSNPASVDGRFALIFEAVATTAPAKVAQASFGLYPNPSRGNAVRALISGFGQAEKVSVQFTDMVGHVLNSEVINLSNGVSDYALPVNLPAGVYNVICTDGETRLSQRIVITE